MPNPADLEIFNKQEKIASQLSRRRPHLEVGQWSDSALRQAFARLSALDSKQAPGAASMWHACVQREGPEPTADPRGYTRKFALYCAECAVGREDVRP